MVSIGPYTLEFAEPRYLGLLTIPGSLAALWVWRAILYRVEVRRFSYARSVPFSRGFLFTGGLGFWLCLVLASSCCVLALARPTAPITVTERRGVDIVVLQDASASMHVRDAQPDRWQRSQRFVRTLVETVSWRGDRMALALFASRTTPQVRLTSDPNVLFFFLDHLGTRSPLSLDNETTWNTNIEHAVDWGLKLVEADKALFGRSPNAQAFVVISDGEAWSGDIGQALARAREQGIPVHVIGAGTAEGGLIPRPERSSGFEPAPRIRSMLDRESLRQIAAAGGGEYFELGRALDREVAFRLVNDTRRRAPEAGRQTIREELYWHFLLAAAIAAGAGTLLLRGRLDLLWLGSAFAAGTVLLLSLSPG